MKVAVTGATGYVGSHIVKYLRDHHLRVYEMGRKPGAMGDDFFIPYQLGEVNDYSKLKEVDFLIHCAYDFNAINKKHNINISGSLALFEEAIRYNIKIIFISSLSAFPGVKSHYGKTKLAIEDLAKAKGALIIRPGLVFGKNMRGIFGAINAFIRLFPIIPLVGKGCQNFYPCHVNDLSHLLYYLIHAQIDCPEPIIAAASQSVTFRQIVNILAEANHKKILCVPVPHILLYVGMRMLEKLHIQCGLRSDSLLSISDQAVAHFPSSRIFEVAFRQLNPLTLQEE